MADNPTNKSYISNLNELKKIINHKRRNGPIAPLVVVALGVQIRGGGGSFLVSLRCISAYTQANATKAEFRLLISQMSELGGLEDTMSLDQMWSINFKRPISGSAIC